jgi:hypothetical protein
LNTPSKRWFSRLYGYCSKIGKRHVYLIQSSTSDDKGDDSDTESTRAPYTQSEEAEMLSTRLPRPKVGAIGYEGSLYYIETCTPYIQGIRIICI